MNKISFTGIRNLSVSHTKSIASPKLPYDINLYSFYGELTNDEFGDDKLKFQKFLEKAGSPYTFECTKKAKPDSFVIHVMETDSPVFKLPKQINFALNYYELKLNSDKVLPLFSFVGQTLTKIQETFAEPKIKQIAGAANDLLMKKMMKYFKI